MEGKTLVAYFSAQGTTASVAEKIASHLKADLFEIKPSIAYTADDLNWMKKKRRSSLEMSKDKAIQEILNDIDIKNYDNVLIGFPIWWYVEPRIIDTFLENNDFSNKTIIPFATSGGSGINKACARMKSLCKNAVFKEGKLLSINNCEKWADLL